MAATAAVIYGYRAVQTGNKAKRESEERLLRNQQIQLDQLRTGSQNQDQKIKDLETKLQSKLDEKARIAAVEASKKSVVEQVVSYVVPHALAAPAGSHTDWLALAGIPEGEWGCASLLINKESGWRVNATNASSGAYGIPQSLPGNKMASAGADWQTNPVTQLIWMKSYVAARYGGFCNAWSHSQQVNWY